MLLHYNVEMTTTIDSRQSSIVDTDGQLRVVRGISALESRVIERMTLLLGEDVYNPNNGLPVIEEILVKLGEIAAAEVLADTARGVDGVEAVLNPVVRFNRSLRELRFSGTIEAEDGVSLFMEIEII